MIERAGRLLVDGRLVPGRVHIEGGRIAAVILDQGAPVPGAQLPILAPGLIDLHVHGCAGFEPLGSLADMARVLAASGTTAFQPTLFPKSPEDLGRDCQRVASAAAQLGAGAARSLGIHLEGPFVNPLRAGALPPAALAAPSPAGLRALLGPATAAGRGVRTMTVAPELPGALDLIRELVQCGVRVSLGHSSATAKEARAGLAAGASGATHLYNAMAPLHHREMGLAGVALCAKDLHVECIGDLVHVGPEALELALRARGARELCLVSDSLRGAGIGCDVFHEHGRDHVRQSGAWFYAAKGLDELRLAGSAMNQMEMVRGLVRSGTLSPEEALTMASAAPARALGLEHELGALTVGARADLLVLQAGTLELAEVLVGGVTVSR